MANTGGINYTTDLIDFIKASKIIPENIIQRTSQNISVYSEDGSLLYRYSATPTHIEDCYQKEYVRYRDKKFLSELDDGHYITFDDMNESECIILHQMNEECMDIDHDNIRGITYQAFINKTFRLENENEVILPLSHINVHFSYPCSNDNVTFGIVADNPIRGFTRLELATKVMQRFHLLYYLFCNYSLEEGEINSSNSSAIFAPMTTTDEYTDNGLAGLSYDKKLNRWDFECINYT